MIHKIDNYSDMENDAHAGGKGRTPVKRKFDNALRPVSPGESGQGSPYAPVDWPNPGDVWSWRVGKRFSKKGFFVDRYLRVPHTLQKRPTRSIEFQSKRAVERYLRSVFPEADISAFFASFTWDIPVKPEFNHKDMENDAHAGPKGRTPVKRKLDDTLRSVSPGESGQGLPYAPVDWPNPGDVWSWRVGKRLSGKGFFHDRYLRVPHTLQERPTRSIEFQSKPAVERYLRSVFPEADVSAFFASFTWDIPVKPEFKCKGNSVHCPEIGRTPEKKVKKGGGRVFKRMQKAASRQKDSISIEGGDVNLKVNDAPGEEKRAASSEAFCPTSPLGWKASADPSLEDFDSYLNGLDEILASPVSMDQSSSNKETITEARKKLSSLLAKGISYLLSSNKVNELAVLSLKLQSDPDLSQEELSMLKLIQCIPLDSKCFHESKEVLSKADEFFGGLDTKISSVPSLKQEYRASKEELEVIQADEAAILSKITDIDQEISNLQMRRQEMTEIIKISSRKLIHFTSVQKRVMENLPKVVQEVQMLKSEKSIWELKKKKADEDIAEVRARFAPLEGFSF